ncbi:hypothetical protein [Aeromonas caviae]|uniref:hypothetical protein n=1 Tax=Aeromonas caviae TaxID=648 RepID=UPI001922D88A|nr:hypothetical protein [Aeromonas caviae]MBL0576349.1 hypothetical protein [Aeromonas caviae]MDX7716278.1 hypothetical protein [Aeromonas caviae]
MKNTLITLAEFHYALGLIGCHEFNERIIMAQWLADADKGRWPDPRLEFGEESVPPEQDHAAHESEPAVSYTTASSKENTNRDDTDWMEFLCLGTWVFTKADPDPYPSIPHGHYLSQNNSWPKLNPYTGRVFLSVHQEDKSKRLSKKDMQKIWRDEKFKSFCREMVVWYKEQHPHIEFPVRHLLRMPRW